MAIVILKAQGERGFLDVEPHLWLRPGPQSVDSGLLLAHSGSESFRVAVESGLVELPLHAQIVDVESPPEADVDEAAPAPVDVEPEPDTALPANLAGMNHRDAAILIMQTDDVETLQIWALEDDRATVLRAIRRRLDALK